MRAPCLFVLTCWLLGAAAPAAQTQDAAEDVGGDGPTRPSLEAMTALDTQIAALREEWVSTRPQEAMVGTDLIDLVAPFICDLPSVLTQLETQQADAPAATLARWQNLIDAHGIEDLPRQTLPQRCSVYASLTLLLDAAVAESLQCQPLQSARRLLTLVPDVPPDHQPEIAALLGDLAGQHAAARAAQADPRTLCPIYTHIESRILDLIGAPAR